MTTTRRTLQAVYENGALRPVRPLQARLREHQRVTLTLTEEADLASERLDSAYHAAAQTEADTALDIATVRDALAGLPGSLTEDCIAERDER